MSYLSIVIPTYNRKDSLGVVLKSLAEQSYPQENYEIILVDNGSSDGTELLVKELAIPNLRHIVQGDSGRAGARNRGIKEASGELVLFTDADIIASPNLLSSHVDFYEKHKECAVVGCEIQVDSLEEYEGVKSGTMPRRTLHKDVKERLQWYFFLTGNALVKRETLIKVGMFDENFTGYGHEDIELGYRLEKMGVPILYNYKAVNYHWHFVGFEEQLGKMHMAGVSTVRFYNKHRDWDIKLRLGMTPFSLFFYSLFSADGSVIKFCEQRRQSSLLCKDIILQRSYVEGIKSALKDKSI